MTDTLHEDRRGRGATSAHRRRRFGPTAIVAATLVAAGCASPGPSGPIEDDVGARFDAERAVDTIDGDTTVSYRTGGGEPAVMDRNAAWLASTDLPMLLLTGDPGFIVQPPAVAYAHDTFENLSVVEVGAGKHFLPEDQPTAVGEAIRDWLPTLTENPNR